MKKRIVVVFLFPRLVTRKRQQWRNACCEKQNGPISVFIVPPNAYRFVRNLVRARP
jgi:hypothetical protein